VFSRVAEHQNLREIAIKVRVQSVSLRTRGQFDFVDQATEILTCLGLDARSVQGRLELGRFLGIDVGQLRVQPEDRRLRYLEFGLQPRFSAFELVQPFG